MLCAHGSGGTVGPAVRHHADALRRRGPFAEVRACALFGEPDLETTLANLAAPRVVVVPFLMAEGRTMRVLARRIEDVDRASGRVLMRRPVGAHAGLAEVIANRAGDACRARDWPPAATALLLIGHGTRRDPASGEAVRRQAARIAAGGRFGEVAAAFLDEPPAVGDAVSRLRKGRCVAVGVFTEAGVHGERDVPALLAASGRDIAYAGPVGADPAMLPLILNAAFGRVDEKPRSRVSSPAP